MHMCISTRGRCSDNGLAPVGTKPSSEPILIYCQVDHWEQITTFFKNMNLNMSSAKWQPFCHCLNVLNLRFVFVVDSVRPG